MEMPFTNGRMPIVTPVFSSDGTEEQVPLETAEAAIQPRRRFGHTEFMPVAPIPFPLNRDPVAEAAAREQRSEELFRSVNPALYDARAALTQAIRVTRHYGQAVSDLTFATSQAAAEANATPDTMAGTKEQRRNLLHSLQAQLREAKEEHAAAIEEMEQAQAGVDELLTKVTA